MEAEQGARVELAEQGARAKPIEQGTKVEQMESELVGMTQQKGRVSKEFRGGFSGREGGHIGFRDGLLSHDRAGRGFRVGILCL